MNVNLGGLSSGLDRIDWKQRDINGEACTAPSDQRGEETGLGHPLIRCVDGGNSFAPRGVTKCSTEGNP